VSSPGPGIYAATLLKVGKLSMLNTLSLEPSHALILGTDPAS
jgi:hypothetical protein